MKSYSGIISYSDYIQKIKRFSKSSVLAWATFALWKAWPHSDINAETREGNDKFCVRSYCPKIAVLSALGNDYRSDQATLQDIVDLSHKYLRISETITDKNYFFHHELPTLQTSLAAIEEKGFFSIADIPQYNDILLKIAADQFFVRLGHSQWAHVGFRPLQLVRAWQIYKNLDYRTGNQASEIFKKYYNLNPVDLIRSGFALFTIASFPKNKNAIGYIDLENASVPDDVSEKLDIDIELLRLYANRFSFDTSEMRLWHKNEVESLPTQYRKYAPICLVSNPLIKIDSSFKYLGNRKHQYVLPSPWHMIWHLSNVLFDNFSEFEANNMNIRSELGHSLHDYMKSFFKEYLPDCSFDFDDYELTVNKPDFMVTVTESSAILVEVKNNFANKTSKSAQMPDTIGSCWERLFEAFNQCSNCSTPAQLNKFSTSFSGITSSVAVICINEKIIAEATSFVMFIENSKLLEKTGLKGLEVMSIDDLEFYLLKLGPKQLFKLIVNKWTEGKGHHFIHQYLGEHLEEYLCCDIKYAKHLEEAAESLFPGFKMNRIGNCI